MPSLSVRTLLPLFLLVVIWAYSWIIMKSMMQYADPFDFAALRYFGGALVLFVVLLLKGESLAPPPLIATLLVGLLQTTAFQALAQLALVTGGAGKVSLFCYTMPFWAILFAWWVLAERPSQQQWLGIILAGVGLALVIEPWHGLDSFTSIALAIGGGAAWAIGTVLSKWMFKRYALSPLNFTAWQMLLGALALIFIAWTVPGKPIIWSEEFIWGLLYSVLLASSLAWLLWTYIVRALPMSVVGLSSLMVPLAAILMAWGILEETPSIIEGVGIAIIMLGLLVIRPSSKRPT